MVKYSYLLCYPIMGKRSEEGEPKERLSLPHKLLDSMAKVHQAYFDGFWVRP